MKANQDQYNHAVTIYDNDGYRAVFEFAEKIGVDSYSYCRECEDHTPDCEDDCCLVCGTHKPSARQIVLTLLDRASNLTCPCEDDADRERSFPPFAGGDDWHKISSMLDLNVWEDEAEVKAAIYLVSDGKTLTTRDCFIPVKVHDFRTKLEDKPESVDQTIERLTNTIENLRVTAQRAINMIESQTRATIIQEALNGIITKHQQSY